MYLFIKPTSPKSKRQLHLHFKLSKKYVINQNKIIQHIIYFISSKIVKKYVDIEKKSKIVRKLYILNSYIRSSNKNQLLLKISIQCYLKQNRKCKIKYIAKRRHKNYQTCILNTQTHV